MSGLCGIANWNGAADPSLIRQMMDAVPYRGPDGEKIHCSGPVAMGYQSTKVSPESINETQPLVHGPTGIVVCADIRLDNRDELSERDQRSPLSDTEIVLSAYLNDKENWTEKLLGDFAIAIWDPRDKTVQLTRDVMAMRSLYYCETSGSAVWSTEIQQMLDLPGIDISLNEAAVAAHLSGLNLQNGMSFYKDFFPVEAGELVKLSVKGKITRRFWSFDPDCKIKYKKESEYADHFREIFIQAVNCRLRSSKPVGISLSGGMDSGSVASTVGWLYEKGMSPNTPAFRTYSWAFDELIQCDERKVSRIITDRYGFPAEDIPADESWPLKDYPDHGPHRDDPFFGMYQFLIDRTVKRAADDGASVLLSGDRGDLIVGGTVLDLPGMFKSGRPGLLFKDIKALNSLTGQPIHGILRNHLLRPLLKKPRLIPPAKYLTTPSHIRNDFIEKHLDANYIPRSFLCDSPDRAVQNRYMHIFTELHMQGMTWSERTNARQGVGFADVWSDRRLAEFVLSIPQYIVHRVHDQKLIARRAMKNIMPSQALEGIGKVSPQPLYLKALREKAVHTVRDLSKNMLSARAGYIDETIFNREMEKLINGQIAMFDLWGALSLEMWLRRYWQ